MAYTQQAGRPKVESAAVNYLTDKDKKDPAPNGVVASNSDKTFGSGVTNELDTVMLTGTNTKKKVDRPQSLRESILNNTADDSYSLYNANTKKTTSQVVDPISGTNFDQTNYSSPLTNYKASTISGNKSVATSSNTFPNTNQYSLTAKSPYAAAASNMVGRMPSTAQDGFQETYSDGNFVRNTRSGKIQSSVPKKGKINTPTQIKTYRTHLKDSTQNRNVRVRQQVKNEQLKDRAGLLKDLISKNK
tara:strand:+ start:359 stop:1096 length:738 start_codon:yes stop_codon:yes gene_type:complete